MMAYEMFIAEEAREQLRSLPEEIRQSIGYRLHLLQQDFSGDIKKLEGPRSHYRLRVGGTGSSSAWTQAASKCML